MSRAEKMLSDMADRQEEHDALMRGLTVAELRSFRRSCEHAWKTDKSGLVDICTECGEGRA
jgi:hypothetical protein